MIIGHTVRVDLCGAVGTTYLTQNQGGSTRLLSRRLMPQLKILPQGKFISEGNKIKKTDRPFSKADLKLGFVKIPR